MAAFAVVVDETEPDPDLPTGTHLRVVPSADLGFPLAPLLVWDLAADRVEVGYTWRTPDDRLLATPDLDAAGGQLLGSPTGSAPVDVVHLGVEARFRGGDGEVALVQQVDDGRGVAARSSRDGGSRPHPVRTAVQLKGSGQVGVEGWGVVIDHGLEAVLGREPLGRLSAPVSGTLPWYADGEGTEPAMARVGAGAPLRLTRPGPTRTAPSTPSPARLSRLGVGTWRDAVDAELGQLLGDPVTPPARVVTVQELPASVAA